MCIVCAAKRAGATGEVLQIIEEMFGAAQTAMNIHARIANEHKEIYTAKESQDLTDAAMFIKQQQPPNVLNQIAAMLGAKDLKELEGKVFAVVVNTETNEVESVANAIAKGPDNKPTVH